MKPILLIEDEHALAGALAAVCRRLGSEPTVTPSGRRGLDAIAAGEFGLVILDIGLPDMSGIDVLTEIRKSDPHLPVVIITAHGNLPNAVAAKRLGAAAYLLKPLDLREVQETLAQVLSTPPRDETGGASRDALGVVFSTGRGATAGKLLRIGHMGPVAEPVYAVVAVTALAAALRRLGRKVDAGAGVEAALAVIAGSGK